jgi:hypothetical protein
MATIIIPEIHDSVSTRQSFRFLARRLLGELVNASFGPRYIAKPETVHLPERVWRRHSALIMSIQERRQYET